MSKEEFDETQDPLSDIESEDDDEELTSIKMAKSNNKKKIKQIDDELGEEDNDDQEDDIYDEEGEEDDLSELSDFEEKDTSNQEKSNIDTINNLELINNFSEIYNEDIIMEKYSDKYKQEYIINNHPECLGQNINEIKKLTNIIKNNNNVIIDEFHKTIPILTKYEKTKILGLRVKQLNSNSKPYIQVDENILDNYIIATMELKEKKLPFIIQRPIQNRFEYWNIKDLEII
jgi:DNA-directed RNA polymerase I, II, and III subunit RPABC2